MKCLTVTLALVFGIATAHAKGFFSSLPPKFAVGDCIQWTHPETCTSQVCNSTIEVSDSNCCSASIYGRITVVHDKTFDVTCRSLIPPASAEMKTGLTFDQALHFSKIACPGGTP